jgi:hypothetical protein
MTLDAEGSALPLQGAGDDDSVPQCALECAMSVNLPRRNASLRHGSRGIVLFVALLVMVALSIAGVALMRSTDARDGGHRQSRAEAGGEPLRSIAASSARCMRCGKRHRSSTARSTPRSRTSTRASARLQALA